MDSEKTHIKIRRKNLLHRKKPHQTKDNPSPSGPVSPAERRTVSALHPVRLSVY
jgi:hypothetical protein